MTHHVLVTGASGGFGKLIVETLLAKGHRVAAAMRSIQDKNRDVAEELTRAGAYVVELDVTDEAQVISAVEKTIRELGGLHAVVNNAGVGVLGVQEQFTPEDWQRLFEVNVFGVQRVNRAVLPHLRQQGYGVLIHISSLLGRMNLPFYGPYNASKWALEAMAESYRVELAGFGVDSCIVEPGGFATTFMHSLLRPSDTERSADFNELSAIQEATFQGFEQALQSNPAQDPQRVADAVLTVLETPHGERPIRTVVDFMGMGDAIRPYNEKLQSIMEQIYGQFQMGHMLQVAPREEV